MVAIIWILRWYWRRKSNRWKTRWNGHWNSGEEHQLATRGKKLKSKVIMLKIKEILLGFGFLDKIIVDPLLSLSVSTACKIMASGRNKYLNGFPRTNYHKQEQMARCGDGLVVKGYNRSVFQNWTGKPAIEDDKQSDYNRVNSYKQTKFLMI